MAKKKQSKKSKSKHVKMKKGDIIADVHPKMVEDYAKGGYIKVKDD